MTNLWLYAAVLSVSIFAYATLSGLPINQNINNAKVSSGERKMSGELPIGSKIPTFSLKDTSGKTHNSKDLEGLVLVVFTCVHCPFAVKWDDRLADYAKKYKSKGVTVIAINPNVSSKGYEDSETVDEMKKQEKRAGYIFPYLIDDTKAVAKSFGATRTPHLFLFQEKRGLIYRGRIDDNWSDPEDVRRHYIDEATDAAISAKEFTISPEMAAQGCSIKWEISGT